MSYLNHVTLSTGHVRRSPRHEVADAVLHDLRPVLARAIETSERIPLIYDVSHFSVRASVESGALLLSLFGPVGPHSRGKPHAGETIPLMTMGVAQRSRQGGDLWARMVAQFGASPGLKKPEEPWCAVVLHEPSLGYPESLEWLGDFERCAAWAWITRSPDLGLVR